MCDGVGIPEAVAGTIAGMLGLYLVAELPLGK